MMLTKSSTLLQDLWTASLAIKQPVNNSLIKNYEISE